MAINGSRPGRVPFAPSVTIGPCGTWISRDPQEGRFDRVKRSGGQFRGVVREGVPRLLGRLPRAGQR